MANQSLRRVENSAGSYFVDNSCISCEACWKEAPENFASHKVHTFAFVFRQPSNLLEKGKCRAAKEKCPVNAIGITTANKA